ncbi:helix-turn-helix domain-containing protein [Brevibacillus marinus]|uniref:helix-turn-helix domain-containing protein n=1 Tax=Brevibacillus marinus TaxID=2496837 RepID=UPI000F84D038|nr:XRE family transcriptional regulator [Brevibacillus marinus]
MDTNNIGKLLRDLRRKKGLTLKELAEKTGLSISFLSQVENSKCSITLQSLSKISDALEVSRSYFFPDSSYTEKKSTKGEINLNQSNFIYQSLSKGLSNPLFEPMLVVLFPNNKKGTQSIREPHSLSSHNGQEFVYVLEGTLTLVHEGEEYNLEPGDSFHINSSTPHTWFNRTNDIVKLIYVYSSPRMFD